MHCPDCRYMLFGLTAPRCPECGRGFETTDFAFRPGFVHFLCPHCRQAYAGNDEFGLPSPRNFQCVRCRKHVAASTMIVKPVRAGACGELLCFGNVWEHRAKVGLIRAFVDSLRRLVTAPREFFRESHFDLAAAHIFCCATAYLTALMLLVVWIAAFALDSGGDVPNPRLWLPPIEIFALLFAIPAFALAWVYAYGLAMLLALRGLGREADLGPVASVAAYAGAVLPALALPFIGGPWYVLVVASGLQEAAQISRGRAVLAALAPLVAFFGLIAAFAAYRML